MLHLVDYVLIHVQQPYDVEPEKKQVTVWLRGIILGYLTASGVQIDMK